MKRSSWEDGLEAIFLPVSIMSLMMMSVDLEFTRAFFGGIEGVVGNSSNGLARRCSVGLRDTVG